MYIDGTLTREFMGRKNQKGHADDDEKTHTRPTIPALKWETFVV
jgi:hypothetical protein